ncbi:MAG: tRNA (adenosine(37)-N6)-dimethylallyltransferase MiaA [Candidatus Nanopelagicales bacterium]|jgi:tRNA dimethylallyltransferase
MIIAIVGPTAVGKSDLAIDLAEMIEAEIVSADSMQVYVGMDIGTAKVTEADRRGVPHHMIDVWDPGHDVSVVEFRDRAREAIEDIEGRGRPVIIVGGSWQYVQAILDELDFPGTDPQVRARLEAELAEHGAAAMHARLAALDAVAAQAILPTNGRRIVRALEVVELEGSFTARLPEPTPWRRARWIGLAVDRLLLDARIAARVDRMWAEGFVDEVRALRSSMGRTARGALGYRQVLDALETDEDLEVARQRTIDGTRKFARRQERRFRQDARVTWVAAGTTAADLL